RSSKERPMAFNEALAERIRQALARTKGVEEKKMFGCICFLSNGNALAGVWKDRLIARLGPDEAEAALREPHVRAFDITGRAMRNGVAVEPEGIEDDDQLKAWIEQASKFVRTLPRK